MIIHNVTIRESGPDGLIVVLEPHGFPRAGEAEARLVSEAHRIGCFVPDCPRSGGSEMVIHRRHSKRPTEEVYLCAFHFDEHRAGETLRLVVVSNR